jgi:hypothetical protein
MLVEPCDITVEFQLRVPEFEFFTNLNFRYFGSGPSFP